MFTGIVQSVGAIRHVTSLEQGLKLAIAAGGLDLGDVRIGDSIAVNGVCLTVTELAPAEFSVEVSGESLAVTCGLDAPGPVNLEKALRFGDRLGGHLVSGHVDGIGEVTGFEPDGECRRLTVRAPAELRRYLSRKGSITVDGVSLTVNAVRGAEFDINLIAHTLAATTLGRLAPGASVNLEVDLLARYLESLLGDRVIERVPS